MAKYAVIYLMVTLAPHCMGATTKINMKEVEREIFGTPPPLTSTTERQVSLCTTQRGDVGVCALPDKCMETVTVTADGDAIDFQRSDIQCPLYTQVCCPYVNKQAADRDATPAPLPLKEESSIIGYDKMAAPAGPAEPAEVQQPTSTCGLRENGKTPWLVLIKDLSKTGPSVYGSVGGGTLIHASVALVAAHTVHRTPRHQLQVLAGLTAEEDVQTRSVDSVELHEQFDMNNVINDIALVFLAEPVDLWPRQHVACLPPADAVPPRRCQAYERTQNTNNGDGSIKTVDVPVLSHQQCQTKYRSTRLGRFFTLHPSFMCAGGERGREVCAGDGGFPLVCPTEKGRVVQYGIVVWDMSCGEHGNPTAYVDVAKFRRWIDHHVDRKLLSTAVYTY